MADEQELLSPEELDDSKYWYDKYHGVRDVEAICKGQVAKLKALACKGTGEKKLDSPDREKIKDIINEHDPDFLAGIKDYDLEQFINAIIALIPDCGKCKSLLSMIKLPVEIEDADQKGYYRGVEWTAKVAEEALNKVLETHEQAIKEAREQERKRIKGLRDTIYRIMQDNTELTEQLSKSVKWDREKVAKKLAVLHWGSRTDEMPDPTDTEEWQDLLDEANQLYKELTGGN